MKRPTKKAASGKTTSKKPVSARRPASKSGPKKNASTPPSGLTGKVSQEMSLLLNNTDESFVLVDTSFRIIIFNKQFQVLYKKYFDINAKQGDSILDYAQSHRRNIAKQIYEAVFTGEQVQSEIELPLPDDTVNYYSLRYKPAYDENGNLIGAFVTISDITHKKETERIMGEERMLLRTLIDNLPLNVYTKDLNSKKTLANRTDYEYAGFTREEEILGKDDLELFSEESARNTIAEDRHIFTTGKSIIGKEEHHIRKDGSDIWFLISKIPLKNAEDEITGLLGISYNITRRKEAEKSLRESEEKYRTLAEELAASNKELEQFAYVASHDLQEPLRMVSSFLQLLQKKYNDQLDSTALQYITYAVDGADRMKQLIMDLLEYSRVGTNEDKRVKVEMTEVVNHVLETFTAKIAESNAVINVKGMPTIKVNKTQITQLVQNLVGNALKYTTSPAPEVEIGCEEKADEWQFWVKDNGIGIERKFYDKVFVIFQRLHNKNEFSGTGIGLAICKKIVERHGGNIWIDSTPGNGSTFFFSIKK
jgi:PAS domain S-box-containing protein